MTWAAILAALAPVLVPLEQALLKWVQDLLASLVATLPAPTVAGDACPTACCRDINCLFDAAEKAAPPYWKFWEQPVRKRLALSLARKTALSHAAELQKGVVLSAAEIAELARV